MQDTEFQFLVVITSPAVLWALRHDRSSFATSNPMLMRLVQFFFLCLVFICGMQLLVEYRLVPESAINATDRFLPTIMAPLGLIFLVLLAKAHVMRAISLIGLLCSWMRNSVMRD